MKKMIVFGFLIMIAFNIYANENQVRYDEIQRLFPGGLIASLISYSTYNDTNFVNLNQQYIVNVMHRNLGLVQLIYPNTRGYFYINDIVNHSFFIKIEKKYFNKDDYFRIKPFTP